MYPHGTLRKLPYIKAVILLCEKCSDIHDIQCSYPVPQFMHKTWTVAISPIFNIFSNAPPFLSLNVDYCHFDHIEQYYCTFSCTDLDI